MRMNVTVHWFGLILGFVGLLNTHTKLVTTLYRTLLYTHAHTYTNRLVSSVTPHYSSGNDFQR
jgi:hypothetical protein